MTTIKNITSDQLIKKRSPKSVLITILILVASIGAIFLAATIKNEDNTAIYLLLLSIGIIGLVTFTILLSSSKKEKVYAPTKSEVNDYSIFIKSEDLNRLQSGIETNDFSALDSIKAEKYSSVRIDAILSKDQKFAACQVLKYIPHSYQPITDIHFLSEDKIPHFATRILELNRI